MNTQAFNLPHNFLLQAMEQQSRQDFQNIESFLTLQVSNLSTYIFQTNQSQRQFYTKALLNFLKKVIKKISIAIEEDVENPIKQVFELLKKMSINGVGYEIEEVIFEESQAILQIFIRNISMRDEKEICAIRFMQNNLLQVQYFRQLLKPVVQVFNFNRKNNIRILNDIDFSNLTTPSQMIWLHFASFLLFQHKEPESQQQVNEVNLIITFINISLKHHNIASLQFLESLILKLCEYLDRDFPDCEIWHQIEKRENISFENFLGLILDLSLRIFMVPNKVLLSKNILFIKTIFTYLKKFHPFIIGFRKIKTLISNLPRTVLNQELFIEERKKLFNTISSVWLEDKPFFYTSEIHELISRPLLQSNNLQCFFWYLIDITGLLEPIQSSETFKNLAELIEIRLKVELEKFLGTVELRNIAFVNIGICKVLIDAIFQLISDEEYRLKYQIQTELPIKLQDLFRPYLVQLLNYDYPDKLLLVWIKFVKLNPLSPLLPLHSSMQSKNYYRALLSQYCQNLFKLHSIQEFTHLYQFIGESLERVEYWWEEVIARQYRPKVEVKVLLQNSVCWTQRQRERCGRLLYTIGKYDNSYWKVEAGKSEKEYAKWFVENIGF